MARILRVNPESPEEETLQSACEELRAGNVVALPTDTIYGLCAHAFDAEAIEKLYALKGRKDARGAPVLIARRDQLQDLASEVSPRAAGLMDALWPAGLTLVLSAAPGLSPRLCEEGPSVAVRMPASALCRALAARVGPFVATSANAPGAPALKSGREIAESFPDGLALVLEAGALPDAQPSTVVDARGESPRLLRAGAVDFELVVRTWNEAARRGC